MELKVAVLDSGIDLNHKVFANRRISRKSKSFLINRNSDDISDNYGHGTAIAGILSSLCPEDVEYIIAKIYESEGTELNTLIDAMKYFLYLDEKIDIMLLSLGCLQYSKELEDLCIKLKNRGVILISAFDNAGAISYPAAYESVIGVNGISTIYNVDKYIYVENSIVNILAKGSNHRVAWLGNTYKINQGSSFSAACIAAKIINLRKDNEIDINELLKRNASRVIKKKKNNIFPVDSLEIRNCVLYPFNKEMHSLINFDKMLNFEIVDIYDESISGNVGKKVKGSSGKEYVIRNISSVNFENVDTFILGHTKELSWLSGRQLKLEVFKLCADNGVNIFMFDDQYLDVIPTNISVKYNQIYEFDYTANFDKLFQIGRPVVGFFGTSARQGKFTWQLALRSKLIDAGYTVGQLGSEPTSLLFNFDYCIPFGYESYIPYKGQNFISYVNYLMHLIELQKDPDLIIVGSQSGTIPLLYNNLQDRKSVV